jgi:glucose/arabinose dehydrogenase
MDMKRSFLKTFLLLAACGSMGCPASAGRAVPEPREPGPASAEPGQSPATPSPGPGSSTDTSTPEPAPSAEPSQPAAPEPAPGCEYVAEGFGPEGTVPFKVEVVATGVEVPWSLAFLPDGSMLVAERDGRVRRVRNGRLVERPVLALEAFRTREEGLLGMTLHPQFPREPWLYLYYTIQVDGQLENRIERWKLNAGGTRATLDKKLFGGIPVAKFHNGGRLRFGPDGMLYASTGDALQQDLAQDLSSLVGKILRMAPDGSVPADNPWPGSPVFMLGVRNPQGFDWSEGGTFYLTDHGPSGEQGRTGHDEVSVGRAGGNLGWPVIYGCERQAGMITPSLTWTTAVPPGGAAIYTGTSISEWKGNLLVASLGGKHLHRVVFDADDPTRVALHEVYLQSRHGRLREAIMGPDGHLYVTTSNCDGKVECPPEKDQVLRLSR